MSVIGVGWVLCEEKDNGNGGSEVCQVNVTFAIAGTNCETIADSCVAHLVLKNIGGVALDSFSSPLYDALGDGNSTNNVAIVSWDLNPSLVATEIALISTTVIASG